MILFCKDISKVSFLHITIYQHFARIFPPNNETLRLFLKKNLLRKKKNCAICVICVRFLSHTDFANGADFLLLYFQIIERNVRKTGEDYLIGTGIDLRISSGTDGLKLVRRFREGHVSIQQDNALAVHNLQPANLLLTGCVLIAETQHVFAGYTRIDGPG